MRRLAALALVCAAACTTTHPINNFATLPRDTAAECANHCSSIELKLSAVVIMSNSVGCVCEPKDAKAAGSQGARAAAAAGELAAAAEAEEAKARQATTAPPPAHH